ncbi:conserved membrane hypothetical protein [Capnocytophaga canimorsus]|uniref:Uncharacterized protein n=1 Tax=Capnocytophaga canimorsus TaxID=28188 RepID=A0A0B7HLN5_9FLAO|nr:gliding motility-associated ABC transporter permease subunit GldF [Capnocytophaga canimorsus]ATA77947.1 gliding motility-associated ABC transporter permease subunit GldF [Capnocytophaga canimorsus]AWL79444.1 gliding motility-associated ABC transporter permease subunit GldF [Capnocytophaga canimorsus]PJI75989.1 ABC-2 type transport system permease protein [Capnocytophaga canimorsus]CEN38438.1 conserved membrane hypothetical protein [Capnocytophaga canimorsus]STA73249.1 ABC-type transport sys
MFALCKKEIRYFFTSPIGWTVVAISVILNGLFLWILQTDYNIFNNGFADLLPFFKLSSWMFVFLIPALTMRSISEEKKNGMLGLLLTKPISTIALVFGKYLGILFLILILLIPSLLYVYMLWQLGNPVGNLDVATTIGSYIALFLLASTFAAVGLWASAVSNNQIVSFVIATFLCFFLFFGLDAIVQMIFPNVMYGLGFQSHFDAISRGVIDSRNLLYFISVSVFFIIITSLFIKSYKR